MRTHTHYIEHFLHEEWAGKRIHSDHVVKTLGSDRDKSCLYYVTEFLEGSTLAEWMRSNPKTEIREARKIIEQIALGLRAFHRMEMLHQDLKPENIMFDLEWLGQDHRFRFGQDRRHYRDDRSTTAPPKTFLARSTIPRPNTIWDSAAQSNPTCSRWA